MSPEESAKLNRALRREEEADAVPAMDAIRALCKLLDSDRAVSVRGHTSGDRYLAQAEWGNRLISVCARTPAEALRYLGAAVAAVKRDATARLKKLEKRR